MTEAELKEYLKLHYPRESAAHEWKGWRKLKSDVSGRKGDDLISYVSGISNMEGGAIVIGVEDQTLNVLGIDDFHDYSTENLPFRLIGNCTNLTSEGLWVEELITFDTRKKIWIVHVPKHQPRRPVYAHKSAWQRHGDSLVKITPERENSILKEAFVIHDDWSREVIVDASIHDLDPAAIEVARQNYKIKFPHLAEEILEWTDSIFLNKAKICINGEVTRAAILLLGLPESTHFLQGARAQITWILKDKNNVELDYEHFDPPFLLNVDRVYSKIRNLKYRYIRDATIFPDELDMYDPFVIREALHNCIAHQDYTQGSRVLVVEFPDRLLFVNNGDFLPGTVQAAIERDAPDTQSRNPFLAQAMFNLNMIDTIGSGIKRMFIAQRKRFFPMPDYDLEDKKVTVQIHGKVIDIEYARLLARNQDLSLLDIILLDRVQKRKFIKPEEANHLRQIGCLEGRKPHYHVSSSVARITGRKADYMKKKGLDDDHYKNMIVEMIRKFGVVSRRDVDNLLLEKLSVLLTPKQKMNKIGTLLTALRKSGQIKNTGSRTKPEWTIVVEKSE